MKIRSRGFTLLELALVLLVITVLLGGLAVPFTRQIETRRIAETNKAMATIQDALVGYAMSHSCRCVYGNTPSGGPYSLDTTNSTCNVTTVCPSTSTTGQTLTHPSLPCPNWDGTGVEATRTSTGDCSPPPPGNIHVGFLPWVTLNVPETDAWGDRYAYDVYLPYANSMIGFSTTPSSSLSSPPDPQNPQPGQLYVCNAAGCRLPAPNPISNPSPYLATQVPAVVISYGPDGLGAFNANNNQWGMMPNPTGAADEYQNAVYGGSNNYRAYVSHPPTESSNGQFDDLVTWLSWPALVNRVCPAGGCP